MSKAVYSKIWMSTNNFHTRRRYGWFKVCSRFSPWVYVWAVYAVSIVFPVFDDEYKKFLTFGIWKESDVGYKKSAPQPYN
ncbi:hypothetical protein PGSY75_0722700 [Plasmodium gaboni]|uniref:Uncharacterized protein n=1 Tax=Plasmodium gaboni TaxID=647221 RepID=A0A151LQD3_9APIC|nr:hypothetical protein PGSY75_0722700 [Plasmodium gaboni]KYO01366.1 hypothetical protein PGSY75_0722700 [Plasmodium gaboni]